MKRFYCWGLLLLLFGSCKKPNFDSAPVAGEVGTLDGYLKNNFDFSLFAVAVEKSGWNDSLNNTSAAYTVMAPLNSALNKDGIYTPSDFEKWSTDSIKNFVKRHIVRGKIFYNDIPKSSDNFYLNINGDPIYLSRPIYSTAAKIDFIVNGVPVQAAGSLSSSTSTTYGAALLNGVVFPIISSLKIYHGTVQEFIASRPDLSILKAGMQKFNLWNTLSKDQLFTVVAPQDSAFARYGVTLDSVAKMTDASYDPVLFGIYYTTPGRLFLMDVLQLNTNNIAVIPFKTVSSTVKLALNVNGSGLGLMTAIPVVEHPIPGSTDVDYEFLGPGSERSTNSLMLGCRFLGETPDPDVYFISASTPPKGTYINYACSNGVVHLLSKILLRPSDVRR